MIKEVYQKDLGFKVDNNIAPLVRYLNENGAKTVDSCGHIGWIFFHGTNNAKKGMELIKSLHLPFTVKIRGEWVETEKGLEKSYLMEIESNEEFIKPKTGGRNAAYIKEARKKIDIINDTLKARETGKELKEKWVSSWRDIPSKSVDSTVHGWCKPKTGEIYAIKGITSKADVEHEKYHVLKKHPDNPRDYRDFVQQELEATHYAYQKTGQPSHILKQLNAIFNDVVINLYRVSPIVALNTIKSKLYSLAIPETWKEDYSKLVKEYNQVFNKSVVLSEKHKPNKKMLKSRKKYPSVGRIR
jgi:hypothetical protein